MTIGTGTYEPSASFALPRSYVYNFVMFKYNLFLAHSGTIFEIHATPPDPTVLTCVLWDKWYEWSSRSYRLDQVVTEMYYKATPGSPKTAFDFKLTYAVDPTSFQPSLYLQWAPLPPDFRVFKLPQQPDNYWLPLPYP